MRAGPRSASLLNLSAKLLSPERSWPTHTVIWMLLVGEVSREPLVAEAP